MDRRNEYQPKGGEALELGVNSGMVREWVAGKSMWSPCYHGRFRGEFLLKRYTNQRHFTLLYCTLLNDLGEPQIKFAWICRSPQPKCVI